MDIQQLHTHGSMPHLYGRVYIMIHVHVIPYLGKGY